MECESIYNHIMAELYTNPREKVAKIMHNVVKQNAIAQKLPRNKIYGVVYQGENYFSSEIEQEWLATMIDILPKFDKDFVEAYKLLKDMDQEQVIIGSYIQHILNSCESVEDIHYLMNKNLVMYLPERTNNGQVQPSAHSREYKAYLKLNRPGRDSLINERILTNMLIKNL